MRSSLWKYFALLLTTVSIGCAGREATQPVPLLIFAAADLRDALRDVSRAFRVAGGDSAILVFGSTGDLATQIANGAPADLFFAANAQAVDDLAAKQLIVDSTRRVYAIGRLAVVARCDTTATPALANCPTLSIADLSHETIKTIAIADPTHAPYGMAAKQALEHAHLWEAVRAKLVLGANIAQADQFVTTGNADAGIIALSLVLRTAGRPYTLVDSALHDPLRQTVAVLARSTHQTNAVALLRFIASVPGRAVMTRYGFIAADSVSPGRVSRERVAR